MPDRTFRRYMRTRFGKLTHDDVCRLILEADRARDVEATIKAALRPGRMSR